MRIIFLEPGVTFIVDILVWVFFHLSIGSWSSRLPVESFNYDSRFYLSKTWEKGGEIYQKLFKVRSWKKFIPSGAALYKEAYEIKHLTEFSVENVRIWLKESCRSEFCHWIMILPGFLFSLWNNVGMEWVMIAYAVLNNAVPIIMQRYNRPRVRKLLTKLEAKARLQEEGLPIYENQQAFSHSYE
ncbi:MAG: hypothetical protein WA110_06065 [Anaerolineaceae bacterium]